MGVPSRGLFVVLVMSIIAGIANAGATTPARGCLPKEKFISTYGSRAFGIISEEPSEGEIVKRVPGTFYRVANLRLRLVSDAR